MTEIVVATKNQGKVKEFKAALEHLPVIVRSLGEFGEIPEPAETGATFEENAILKARYYAARTGKCCLADDSGLEVDALGGAPGVYSARYAGEKADDSTNNQKLIEQLKNVEKDRRTARFKSVVAYATVDGEVITSQGVCEGVIASKPRGSGGFGYDPLFYLPELDKTMAELSTAEKNEISHRGKAIRQMVEKLAGIIK